MDALICYFVVMLVMRRGNSRRLGQRQLPDKSIPLERSNQEKRKTSPGSFRLVHLNEQNERVQVSLVSLVLKPSHDPS